jgi:hypothetical protein
MGQVQPARSLFEYLTGENAELDCSRCRPGNNSSNLDWFVPRMVIPWEDFNFETFEDIYNGLLKRVLAHPIGPRRFPQISEEDCEISCEESCTALILKSNHTVVSGALLISTKELVKEWPFHRLAWVLGRHASPLRINGRNLHPDWAGIHKSIAKSTVANGHSPCPKDEKPKAKNILPGDTKVSRKWTSDQVEKRCRDGAVVNSHGNRNWLRPIMQIFTYCVIAESRYGYIITDKELVAIRVRPRARNPKMSPTEAVRRDGVLEYKSISWKSHRGETPTDKYKELTINLALWWLHILADNSRSIDWEYRRLSTQTIAISLLRLHEASDAEETTHHNMEPPNRTQSFVSTMGLGDLELASESNNQTASSRRSSLRTPREDMPIIEEEATDQLMSHSPLRRRSSRIGAIGKGAETQQQRNTVPRNQSASFTERSRKRKRGEVNEDASPRIKARY